MNIHKRKVIIAYFIIVTMFLSGCGKNNMEVPDLIEPASVNESYGPVEYRDIGGITIQNGVVVPTYYCSFWKTSASIEKINVDIGDYVTEGQILASANSEKSEEIIESLNSEVTYHNSLMAVTNEKFQNELNRLNYKLEACVLANDVDGTNAVNKEIETLKENNRFDIALTEMKIKNIKDQIADHEELISDVNLVARKSGYVTYVKDIEKSATVVASENVVIVSDYEDCYIELQESTIDDKIFEKYVNIFTKINNKRVELEEYPYSRDELIAAQGKGVYPNNRLKYSDSNQSMEVGTSVPIFMQRSQINHVLSVANNSLYNDEKGDFVYVKKDDGLEARYVELGESDIHYSQVLSGLEEGELVYYISDSVLPEYYEPYEITLGDYKVENETRSYETVNTRNIGHYSEYEGTISQVNIQEGSYVNKGDLLYKIATEEGNARLTQMQVDIENAKAGYEDRIKELDVQIESIRQKIKTYEEGLLLDNNTTITPSIDDKNTTEPGDGTGVANELGAGDGAEVADGIGAGDGTDIGNESNADVGAGAEAGDGTDTEEPIPSADDFFVKEQLLCQITNIEKDKEYERINYEFNRKNLEEIYAKASENNDGTGNINIYSDYSGVVSTLRLSEGKIVVPGNRFFTIKTEATNKVIIKSTTKLALNQEILFTDLNSGDEYKGIVVGSTGSVENESSGNKVYMTTLDGKVYVNSCISSDTKENFFIKMEDDGFYERSEKKDVKYLVTYNTKTIKDAMEIPSEIIHADIDERTLEEYYFVWKIVDGNLVKQYIQVSFDNIAGQKSRACVLSGLSEGDIVAYDFIYDNEEE